jgi:hypothetical protein
MSKYRLPNERRPWAIILIILALLAFVAVLLYGASH